MLKATSTADNPLQIDATVNGVAIYLDNHSYIELERDPDLRRRFVASTRSAGDLLFSIANAVELTATQGESLRRMKAFLDEIGAQWFPLEMDPHIVFNREQNGYPKSKACVSEEFLKTFLMLKRSDRRFDKTREAA